jgi:hypothetical protein
MNMSAWRGAISISLRRHYPDQVDGSVAAATLSARRIVRAPRGVMCSEPYRATRCLSGSMIALRLPSFMRLGCHIEVLCLTTSYTGVCNG